MAWQQVGAIEQLIDDAIKWPRTDRLPGLATGSRADLLDV
jgi:hypothetical protein